MTVEKPSQSQPHFQYLVQFSFIPGICEPESDPAGRMFIRGAAQGETMQ